jgi:hypothetical protein
MSRTPTHVAQARGELDNARAYGQGDAVKAAEKRLAAAGVSAQRAAAARRDAAEESPEPERQRTAAPRGRTTAPQQTTQAKRPPTSGPGSGVEAWRAFAAAVSGDPPEVFADATRDDLVARFGGGS